MKRMLKKFCIAAGILMLALLAFIYIFFYSTLPLAKGEVFEEIPSPNKRYTAIVSMVNTEELVTRVDILNNESKKKRLIYWNWREGNLPGYDVKWIDDKTVIINGTELNVIKDRYDRRNARISTGAH